MKPNDAALRSALIDVLDSFGVSYTDANRNGHPRLTVMIGNMTHRLSYDSSTEDTRAIVRKLHNMLIANGYSMREPVAKRRPDERPRETVPEPAVMRQEAIEERPAASVNDKSPPVTDEVSSHPNHEPLLPAQTVNLMTYRPLPTHVPTEVMIIKAEVDLIIVKGECVIIPVHRPGLMFGLTEEEAALRYMPSSFQHPAEKPLVAPVQPIVAAAAPQPPPLSPTATTAPVMPPPVAAVVQDRPSPVTAPSPPSRHYQEPRLVQPDLDEAFASMSRDMENLARAKHKVAIYPVKEEPKDAPVEELSQRANLRTSLSYGGVRFGAQLGRIMAGILQAMRHHGTSLVTASEASQFITPHDRKQIAARIHLAVRSGWVKIGQHDGPGFTYAITQEGEKLVEAHIYQCYTDADMEPPPFVQAMVKRAG